MPTPLTTSLSCRPIGIFDSGVGGLSVYQHLQQVLPHENFLYYADTLNVPYGDKSADEITHLTFNAVSWLIKNHCKLIVVACNSASAYALSGLRQAFDVPIVGLVPAIKPACASTNTKKIALLATQATIDGKLLCEVISKYATPFGMQVLTHFEPKLVPWVESGMPIDHNVADLLIKQMYAWLDVGVDTLVLGCTHYPFFRAFLQNEIDKNHLNIRLIDSGRAVALRVQSLLGASPTKGVPSFRLYSSANDTSQIQKIAKNLIDTPICFVDKMAVCPNY